MIRLARESDESRLWLLLHGCIPRQVTHVDFSADGQYLQCDSLAGGELLFFDTER